MKKALFSIMVLVTASAIVTGCLTRASAHTKKTIYPDGRVEFTADTSIVGTGDKASQVAGEGMFADGTADDLGAGFKKGNASQQSTGIGDTLSGIAQVLEVVERIKSGGAKIKPTASSVPEEVPESVSPIPAALPAETDTANASVLSAKMAEAKASGKPFVVLAGNVGCGYCSRLDKLLDADSAFLARTDIVLYRETSAWATNAAGKWTGGGKFPVLRVTQWDTNGVIVCDNKINRPQSVADIDAALKSCESKD